MAGKKEDYFHLLNAAGDVEGSIKLNEPFDETKLEEGKEYCLNGSCWYEVQSFEIKSSRVDVYLEKTNKKAQSN